MAPVRSELRVVIFQYEKVFFSKYWSILTKGRPEKLVRISLLAAQVFWVLPSFNKSNNYTFLEDLRLFLYSWKSLMSTSVLLYIVFLVLYASGKTRLIPLHFFPITLLELIGFPGTFLQWNLLTSKRIWIEDV